MKKTATEAEGPVAIITGGSGALGQAIGREFLDNGYRVVLAARDLGRLQETARDLGAFGSVVTVGADVTDSVGRETIIAEALKSFGRLDVLVNNAGAEHIGRLEHHQLEDVQLMTAMNLVAPIELSRLAAPVMDRVGGGHIVNIATMAAKTPMTTMTVYGATKAGLGHFSRVLRSELGERNIGVSAVYPGAIQGAGMFAEMQTSTGVEFPKAMPTSEAAWVAKQVMKAVRRNLGEVLAAPGGKVMARHPRLAGFMLRRMGVAAAFADVADRRASQRNALRPVSTVSS